MAEIVNLNRARKAKAKKDRVQTAAENRARFGRTKAERQREEKTSEIEHRKLDQHRRKDEPD